MPNPHETAVRVIPDKRTALAMLRAGLLGNTLRTWASVAEMRTDGYTGSVTLRHAVGNTPLCRYRVPNEQIDAVIAEWVAQGASAQDVQLNESAPDDRLVLQGEVQRLPGGLNLTYSREQKPMRDALRGDGVVHAFGLGALGVLERNLWPSDYSDLQALLELYPDSVVEFSCYEIPVGCIPNRAMVIWEVRNY